MNQETIMLIIVSGFAGGLIGSILFLFVLSMTNIWTTWQRNRYQRKHHFQVKSGEMVLEPFDGGYKLKPVVNLSDEVLDLSKEKVPKPGDLSDI